LAAGILTVALTYALARRMFGVRVALVAAGLLAVSFWPIMYGRIALRQIWLLPWMLVVYLVLYRLNQRFAKHDRLKSALHIIVAGICLGIALMTYYSSRVLPVVIIVFALYLLLLHRDRFKHAWRGMSIVLIAGLILAAPMLITIAQIPGGEERINVVGPQLAALRNGDLRPAIETTISTLGMFTFRGDPEALYNIEGRPVFDWIAGAFFYIGVAIALWRWKRIEYGLTLIALMFGLAPAFVSNPPGSFGHTIAAMPIVYMLAGLGVVKCVDAASAWAARRMTKDEGRTTLVIGLSSVVLIFLLNTGLTIRDYFGTWARDDYVRFLYHAPVREVAQWLERNPEVQDIAIATHPNYFSLEPLALWLDLTHMVEARFFDPAEALVENVPLAETTLQVTGKRVAAQLAERERIAQTQGAMIYNAHKHDPDMSLHFATDGSFAQQLALLGAKVTHSGTIDFDLLWQIEANELPGTLKMFVHAVDADGAVVAQFDGIGVYLPSMHAGDRFIQFVSLNVPPEMLSQTFVFQVGVYDAVNDVRLRLSDGREFIEFVIER